MNELALFAGAGGGILGGHLLGWRTVCAVEWNKYAASVLLARQNDGILPPFPIWDDVQTFDGRPWRGIVDVVSGGFPCQDISSAGKGVGITGERSGMWKHMARIIGEIRPRLAYIENSPMLTIRGLDVVLCDLAAMGYDAEWGVVSAADTGAPHLRERIWIVGYTDNDGQTTAKIRSGFASGGNSCSAWPEQTSESTGSGKQYETVANTNCLGQSGQGKSIKPICRPTQGDRKANQLINECVNREWPPEPDVGRVVDGMAARMDRLTAIGNGQVPVCAATAFKLLSSRL